MYKVPSARRKKRKFTPLNLIPILDVVFILIFFLLASAQLLRIFEIGSDLPIFRVSTKQDQKEDQFELKVTVNKNSVLLTNYKKGVLIKKINVTDWENEKTMKDINEALISIKKSHPDENRVVVTAQRSVSYQDLVMVLDNVRTNNQAGVKEEDKFLFRQIMFEE